MERRLEVLEFQVMRAILFSVLNLQISKLSTYSMTPLFFFLTSFPFYQAGNVKRNFHMGKLMTGRAMARVVSRRRLCAEA